MAMAKRELNYDPKNLPGEFKTHYISATEQDIGEMLANNVGLTDWIATHNDDYVAKAVALANDLDRLSAIRSTLRGTMQKSALYDGPRFARNFEQLMNNIWQKIGSEQGV